jgi:hypothetical protein
MPRGIKKGQKKQTEEEHKANERARGQTPKARAYQKARRDTPEYKAYVKKYRANPENKARKKALDKIKNTPERISYKKKNRENSRLKVLQYYSKKLSDSNIPCCNCCGLNSDIKFLAIDHILGKKVMDTIPEVVKLGYSSKFKVNVMLNWIIANNYLKDLQTEYFQILCHNCNLAKGYYGKCPMENKPH